MEEKHDGCCKSCFPLHAPNWPSFLPKKRNQLLLPAEWEGQTQVSANGFMEKFSLCFWKKWMFPVKKNKKGLSWPCRLRVLIGEHGSATIKWIKCNWFFCKYNCTAVSQSTYLSCNYTVFSTLSSHSSLQKGIYTHTCCLSFIGHVLHKAFKKDSELIFIQNVSGNEWGS